MLSPSEIAQLRLEALRLAGCDYDTHFERLERAALYADFLINGPANKPDMEPFRRMLDAIEASAEACAPSATIKAGAGQ